MAFDENIDLDAFISSFGKEGNNKVDTRYQYMHVGMTTVMNDIDEYIIPELQAACKALWEKNIYTFMCSNREDVVPAYIILLPLSDENKNRFEALKQTNPGYFIENRGYDCINIPDVTKMSEEEISNTFLTLISNFVKQDVQPNFYQSAKDYLISCGCYEEIDNPNYVKMDINDFAASVSLENLGSFVDIEEPTIKVFSQDKMEKSFEEYVYENGDENRVDFSTGNVYVEPYFLERHLEFVKSQNNDGQVPV